MPGKMSQHTFGVYEQNPQVVQDEDDMEGQSILSMTTLANKMDDVSISGTTRQDDFPTYAIPEFDIQKYLFGDLEELTTTRNNIQQVIDRYVTESCLPSSTNLTLSTIPTGWVLGLYRDEDEENESGHELSPTFATSGQQFSYDGESLIVTGSSRPEQTVCKHHPYEKKQERKKKNNKSSSGNRRSTSYYMDNEGFTDGDGGFGGGQINN